MPHSPGPWKWEERERIVAADGEPVLDPRNVPGLPLEEMDWENMLGTGYGGQKRHAEDDARLIAAAPELAAALRKLTAELRRRHLADEVVFGRRTDERRLEVLQSAGVLEAEALLKRIDEGGVVMPPEPACEACHLMPAVYGEVPAICARCNATYVRRSSDLDTFRAMLGRAGIYADVAVVEDERKTLTGGTAISIPRKPAPAYLATFVFGADGRLVSIDGEGR